MSSKKIFCFSVVAMALFATGLYYLFNYEGKLESIRMDNVYVAKGDSLETTAEKIQNKIRVKGDHWLVEVEEELKVRISESGFGGGGSALFVVFAAEQYGCSYEVISEKKVIRFCGK